MKSVEGMEKCSLACIIGNLSILQQLWKSANRVIQPRYFTTSASRRQESVLFRASPVKRCLLVGRTMSDSDTRICPHCNRQLVERFRSASLTLIGLFTGLQRNGLV